MFKASTQLPFGLLNRLVERNNNVLRFGWDI